LDAPRRGLEGVDVVSEAIAAREQARPLRRHGVGLGGRALARIGAVTGVRDARAALSAGRADG
jgi:hypothetical protein